MLLSMICESLLNFRIFKSIEKSEVNRINESYIYSVIGLYILSIIFYLYSFIYLRKKYKVTLNYSEGLLINDYR